MNISINYSPATLEDFKAAVEFARQFAPAQVVVETPKVFTRDKAVSLYCARVGRQRYVRTAEGQANGLSPLEDLKARALAGDDIAAECLSEEIESAPVPEADESESEPPKAYEAF